MCLELKNKRRVRIMKLRKLKEIQAFMDTVNSCVGTAYLTSEYGDKYVLNSTLSKYVALSDLLSEKGDILELWCSDPEDEERFRLFFEKYPEVL